MKMRIAVLLMVFVLLLQGGCNGRDRIEVIEQVCEPDISRQDAVKIAEDVLGRMHFTIEKSDPQQGIIRTKPLPGAQSFEFWRSDNVGRYNTDLANLHSIQRIAELKLTEQNGQICIDCSVQVARLSLPQSDIAGTPKPYNTFSESGLDVQKLRISGEAEQDPAWINMGNDEKLQSRILNRIQEQFAKVKK